MFILILTKLWRQVFRKRQKFVLYLSTHTHPENKQTNKPKDQDGMVRFCHSIKKQDYIGHEV